MSSRYKIWYDFTCCSVENSFCETFTSEAVEGSWSWKLFAVANRSWLNRPHYRWKACNVALLWKYSGCCTLLCSIFLFFIFRLISCASFFHSRLLLYIHIQSYCLLGHSNRIYSDIVAILILESSTGQNENMHHFIIFPVADCSLTVFFTFFQLSSGASAYSILNLLLTPVSSFIQRAEPILTRMKEDHTRIILPAIDNIKYNTFEVQQYANAAHGYNWGLWCMYIIPPQEWLDKGDETAPIRWGLRLANGVHYRWGCLMKYG